jgi:hypothetical protein
MIEERRVNKGLIQFMEQEGSARARENKTQRDFTMTKAR